MGEPDEDKSAVRKTVGEVAAAVVPYAILVTTLVTAFREFGPWISIGSGVRGAAIAVLVYLAVKKGWRTVAAGTIAVLLVAAAFIFGRWTAPDSTEASQDATAELNATIISRTPKGSTEVIPFAPPPGEVAASAAPVIEPDVIINGRIENYDASHDLWTLVAPENSDDYIIQSGVCAINSDSTRFYCSNVRAGSGQNVGWQIFAVRTTKERSREWQELLSQKRDRLDGLPDDVVRMDAKTVIR